MTGFDCSNVANQGIANTSISLLPISSQLLTLDASGNPLLFCIEVADITQASANVSSGLWIIDSHASFSTDTFWSNDFSNASDWTMVDLLNGGLQNWVITTNGPQGWYSSAMGPIASTTAANGFALYDSDALNSQYVPQQATLIVVDCSQYPFVSINFECYHRVFRDSVFVEISLDNF